MAYSLGLTLYNLAGRPPAGVVSLTPRPQRPLGRLIWLHAPDEESLAILCRLAEEIQDQDGHPVLISGPMGVMSCEAALQVPAPWDAPREAQDFLDYWRPDIAVFAGGEVMPAVLHECQARKLPCLMIAAQAPHLPKGREGWFPGLVKSAMQVFSHILVQDEANERAFRKAGAEPGQIRILGRMAEASVALDYVESDRAAMAQMLAARPIWLAADVSREEIPLVLDAHARAMQLAHRLLLILVPQDPSVAPALVEKLEADRNWRAALRRADQDPEPETEVLLAEAQEYGLWYRLAPVTFLGGSLEGQGCARNPMEPAALGSAILYGPRAGEYGTAFGRLGAARAARMVASGGDLAEALSDLLSPDRAARQAAAAWDVASDGTEATETVLLILRGLLEGES
jgi:3-deoxy-D-manno-octulosonic-acid transferase